VMLWYFSGVSSPHCLAFLSYRYASAATCLVSKLPR
jgi:hypothetical protein